MVVQMQPVESVADYCKQTVVQVCDTDGAEPDNVAVVALPGSAEVAGPVGCTFVRVAVRLVYEGRKYHPVRVAGW